MAEFVQQHIEDMLPELEQMERVGLFRSEETRKMLKKRRAYEYKLRRRTRLKEDYLNYAQYEINVMALVRKRREKTGYTFKRQEIDIAILQRIHRLFKHACYRFQDDVKLWLSYIAFCKSRNEKRSVSKIYARMLQVQTRKPALWISAAKYEVETQHSMDNARSLLQRGIRFNPESPKLWHEYYRFELLNAEKLRKRRKVLGLANMEVDDDEANSFILDGKVALVVYSKACDSFPDNVEAMLGFLFISQLFDFTQSHQQQITEYLKMHFSNNELTWDALARTHIALLSKTTESDISTEEKKCFKVFDEAVTKVQTERMWELYLTCCLQRINSSASLERVNYTIQVFKRAKGAKLLSAPMFLKWVTVLKSVGKVEELAETLADGTAHHKTNCDLWLARLTWSQLTKNESAIAPLFNKCISSVPKTKALPLWQAMINWATIHYTHDQMRGLFERAVQCHGTVAEATKTWYLEWLAIHQDMQAVRKVYHRLCMFKPCPLHFFKTYINLEESQVKTTMKYIRAAYETAVSEFGAKETGIWLDYIRSELKKGQGQSEKVGQIYWRALRCLDTKVADDFTEVFTLMQTGHAT